MPNTFIEHIRSELSRAGKKEEGNSELWKTIEMGLPTGKNEKWKYTSLKRLEGTQFSIGTAAKTGEADDLIKKMGSAGRKNTLIIHNGIPLLDAFSPAKGIKVTAGRKSQVDELGSNDFFTALNLLSPGKEIGMTIEGDQEGNALRIYHMVETDTPILCQEKITIHLQEGAILQLEEYFMDGAGSQTLTNSCITLSLEKNARLTHYKIERNTNSDAFLVDSHHVLQKGGSQYTSFVINLGRGTSRNNLHVSLDEPEAKTELYGLYVLSGKDHVDHLTQIDHKVPDCLSDQFYKGVIGGEATGVFSGKIVVFKDAQRTNAFQNNRNLLISDHATINSKPQLEIFADDVKCSHGATSSQLEDNPLFYLRSRGIARKEAEAMLTMAFASEILSRIGDKELQEELEIRVQEKLKSAE